MNQICWKLSVLETGSAQKTPRVYATRHCRSGQTHRIPRDADPILQVDQALERALRGMFFTPDPQQKTREYAQR